MAAFRYTNSLSLFLFWCTSKQYQSTRHASKTQPRALLLNQKVLSKTTKNDVWKVEESYMLLGLHLPVCSWFQWLYSLAFSPKVAVHSQNSVPFTRHWTRLWFGDKKMLRCSCSHFYWTSLKKRMSGWAVLCATLPVDSQLKSLVANCYPDSRANALLRHRECQSLSRDPISARQEYLLWDATTCYGGLWAEGEVMIWDCFPWQHCSVPGEAHFSSEGYRLLKAAPLKHTGRASTCSLVCF